MNKETLDLVKRYVTSTLNESNGIQKDAYDALISLMQINRDFAQEMHDEVNNIVSQGNRYLLSKNIEENIEYGQEL